MSGVVEKGRMELMGYKTAGMSERYAHLPLDYKRAAVAKLPTLGTSFRAPAILPIGGNGESSRLR